MADRISQLGAVQRVEVEVAHPARIKLGAQLGGDGGGDELASLGQRVQPLEQPVHPVGDRSAALGRELAGLRDVGDRQYAGHELGVDANRGDMIAEAEEGLGREEELRDRPVRARVEAATEISNGATRLRPPTRAAALR